MPKADASPKTDTTRPSYIKLLSSNHSLLSLWVGQLVSNSGDSVFDVALLWVILETTGSVFLVGLTQAAILVTPVVVGPIAGVYVDRFNRRNVILLTNIVEGIITGAISFAYFFGLLRFFPLIIALVLLLYSAFQFFRAAMNAIIPGMVGPGDLGAANSLFSLSTYVNQLGSYTIGGIIIAIVGAEIPIAYDSLTFFFAAVMTIFVAKSYGEALNQSPPTRIEQQEEKAHLASSDLAENNGNKTQAPDLSRPALRKRNFKREFTEGLRYIRSNKILVELVILGSVINFFAGGFTSLLAPYSANWLHGNASTYGFVLAGFSLGMFSGSFMVGKLNFRPYVGKLLFTGVILAGVTLALLGLSRYTPLSIGLFFIFGLTLSTANLPLQVLIQAKVPQELLGRVMSALTALLVAAQPIGAAVSGGFATYLSSVGEVLAIYGFMIVLIASLGYFAFMELRRAKF